MGSKWIHPLADLGYDAQLIEQTISLSKNAEQVKPDVITASNKQLNALVVDCKGGKTVEGDQLNRYKNLVSSDLARRVTVYDPKRLSHDICLITYELHQKEITSKNKDFPTLVIGKEKLVKMGTFGNVELEKKFKNEIKIETGMLEPLSYYPFSENEDKEVIIPYVLRAIVTILTDVKKKGINALDKNTFNNEEILRIVHKLWDILSLEHQNSLRSKVEKVIIELYGTYPKFKEQVEAIQNRDSSSTVAISNLIKTCYDIMSKEATKTRLDEFPHQ